MNRVQRFRGENHPDKSLPNTKDPMSHGGIPILLRFGSAGSSDLAVATVGILSAPSPGQRVAARKQERRQSRALLCQLLSAYPLASAWRIREKERGPSVESADGREFLYCSVSHCRDGIAVVVARNVPVGIDIECRLPRNRAAVAQRLGDPPCATSDHRFLRLWTLWEAFCKLRGRSCLEVPPKFCRDLVDAGDLSGQPFFAEDFTAAWTAIGSCTVAVAVDGEHEHCSLST